MIGTIPDAFSAAFGTIDQLMTSFALRTRSLTMSVMSMWQAMKDFIAGSTTMRPVINFDAAGNASEGQIPLTDFYKESAAALNSQVAQLEENMKAGSGAKVMSDALSNFEPIDIRDYFSRVAVDDGKGGSGGGSKKTFQELLSALEKENNLNRELVGVYGDKRNVLETVNEFEKELNRNLTENEIKKVEIAAKEQYRIEQMSQLMDTVSGHIESAFMSFVDGSKSVEDAFKSMLRNIILAVYQQEVAKPAANAISNVISAIFKADGGAFNKGVEFYANGGVVGSPTMFGHSGGLGVMGEAGPEAIMPLKRGKNGKLGVQMEGSSQPVVVNNNFNISANGDDSVKRIVRGEIPRITEATKAAVVDAKRRGGSYGRAF
jgi:phage-related minor tail protein